VGLLEGLDLLGCADGVTGMKRRLHGRKERWRSFTRAANSGGDRLEAAELLSGLRRRRLH